MRQTCPGGSAVSLPDGDAAPTMEPDGRRMRAVKFWKNGVWSMELQISHKNRAIILWLSSEADVDLEEICRIGKGMKYRVVVIRSGFGDLFSDTSSLLWFNRSARPGNHFHGCGLAAALH